MYTSTYELGCWHLQVYTDGSFDLLVTQSDGSKILRDFGPSINTTFNDNLIKCIMLEGEAGEA